MVTRKRMYVPCSIEYFHAWRNMMAEEHRKRELETRCLIPSERYSYLKKCMGDCSKCPYGKDHRDGLSLSLDRFVEEDGYEIVDELHSTPIEIIIEDERKAALAREIALLDEESQQILNLFNKGYSETQIAGLLGLTRDMVKRRKTALFQRLKKNLRNY